jgi:hypothetical protein
MLYFSVSLAGTSRLKPHHISWKIARLTAHASFFSGRAHAGIAANDLKTMNSLDLGEPARLLQFGDKQDELEHFR